MPVSGMVGNWPQPQPVCPAVEPQRAGHLFPRIRARHARDAVRHALRIAVWVNVRGDFGEAPSQMLENWMWQPAVLKKVSARVDTGEPLPDDLIAKMIAAKHINDGVHGPARRSLPITICSCIAGSPIEPNKLWFDLMPKLRLFHEIPAPTPSQASGI